MNIEVNGKLYGNFMSATANIRIDALSNSFSFTSAQNADADRLPILLGDECSVYVDGERVITGHIEVISGSGSAGDYSLDYSGRDSTGDIVDSQISTMQTVKPPITFKRLCEKVIANIGSEIEVIDYVGASFDKSEDLLAPEVGDNAFEYMEKMARKKQCILTSDADGNVNIQKSRGEVIRSSIVNKRDGQNNNVLSYTFNYDNTGRFYNYSSVSNDNINVITDTGNPSANVNQTQTVIDKSGLVREGRQFIITMENTGGPSTQKARAEWERNIRSARSRTYSAVVSGFRNSEGNVWYPNMVAKVIDDQAGIDDYLMINSVTYRMSQDSGRTTELSFVNKNAYTLEIAEPKSEKASGGIDSAMSAKIQAITDS